MADIDTMKKWDRAAPFFDIMAGEGAEKRWLEAKRALFSHMQGDVLLLAAGTGLDFAALPPGRRVTAIDISAGMLSRAAPRARRYAGDLQLVQMDVNQLAFADASFDQVYTSCTLCSVPRPVHALQSLRRALRPGGTLFMFEHTGSRYFPFNLMLHAMDPLSRRNGPSLTRDTVANVAAAGFTLTSVNHLFLDVVKTITAVRPAVDRTP